MIITLKEQYSKEKLDPSNRDPVRKKDTRWKYIWAFENELDKGLNEPYWLEDDAIASIVMDSLLFNNGKQYELFTACIMSNHVHHKKFTAVQSNKMLNRSGQFWAEESFDTLIRDNTHFYNVVNYIINNPVKVGLVKNWNDWKWAYIHPELDKDYRTPGK